MSVSEKLEYFDLLVGIAEQYDSQFHQVCGDPMMATVITQQTLAVVVNRTASQCN